AVAPLGHDRRDQLLLRTATRGAGRRISRLRAELRARNLERDREARRPLPRAGLDVDRRRDDFYRRNPADRARRDRRVHRRYPRRGEGASALRHRRAGELLRPAGAAATSDRGRPPRSRVRGVIQGYAGLRAMTVTMSPRFTGTWSLPSLVRLTTSTARRTGATSIIVRSLWAMYPTEYRLPGWPS